MRIWFLISWLLQLSFCIAQNKIAIVTTKKNQTAYYDLKGTITYIENTDPVFNESICKFNDGFARLRRTNKFYFIDEFGKPIFTTVFEKAEDFEEGLAEVKNDGKWGFINKKGEIVIKPQFYETHPFSFGLSQVAFGPKEKHGYIDSTGNFIIKPQFDNASAFVNDKAWVLQNGKWGLINKDGKFVINPTYKEIKNIFELYNAWAPEYSYNYITGLIQKSKYKKSNLVWASLDGKWGLINKEGKNLINHQFVEVKNSSEGFTWVKEHEFWGLMDSLGNYLIKPNERNPLIYASNVSFKVFSEVHNGLIRYQTKDMYGYQDTKLNIVIPAKFDKATDFKNGLATVNQDGYWGVIDTTGKFIIPINYKEIILSDSELFPAKDDNGDWGYLNLKNEWVVKPQFKNVTSFAITNYK
jgi:hypothetical protein